MPQIREMLVEQLQDLLDAETQITGALPKMVEAAKHPKLKAAFEKHLVQTEQQVERLRKCFELLGEQPEPKPCRGITGLIEEGQEIIEEGSGKEPIAADLALIAAAQKVEHYEIAGYGTVRTLARQIGEIDCARLISHTLGEEESTDFLLTAIADPLLQQATLEDQGADVNLESVPKRPPSRSKRGEDADEDRKQSRKVRM